MLDFVSSRDDKPTVVCVSLQKLYTIYVALFQSWKYSVSSLEIFRCNK